MELFNEELRQGLEKPLARFVVKIVNEIFDTIDSELNNKSPDLIYQDLMTAEIQAKLQIARQRIIDKYAEAG